MKMQKDKTTAIATTLILLFSIAASAAFIPNVSAHDPSWEIATFPHIYVETDPVGVGQTAYVYMWLTPTYPDEAVTNDYRFHNYKLTITSPTGKVTEQNFPTCQDTTSNQGTTFVPDEVGVYTLTFDFPGQAVNDYSHAPNSPYMGDTFKAGSASTTMTVQEDPVPITVYPPLPTEYWTRPIFGENNAWWVITSNWLGTGMPGYAAGSEPNTLCFSGDSVGSQTSHIMWTKSIGQPGGVVGGNNLVIPGNTWFEGTAYAQRYTNPIIVAGMLVYMEPFESNGGVGMFGGTGGDTVCVNLYTGEEIWRNPNLPGFSFAYVQDEENPDFHGVRSAYLVAATGGFSFFGPPTPASWQLYDAATGKSVANATGIPSGTKWVGPDGEVMQYVIYNNGTTQIPDYYLCLWNSSRWWGSASMSENSFLTTTTTTTGNTSSTTYVNGSLTTTLTQYSTRTVTVPADKGYMYEWLDPDTQNVSISWRNGQTGSPSILAALPGDLLLCRNGSYPTSGGTGGMFGAATAPPGTDQPYNYFAVNLNASVADIGKVLWMNTVQPYKDPEYGYITSISFAGATQSGFCESYRQTEQFAFFNIRTGAFIKLSDPQPALDYYGSTGSGSLHSVVAFDRLYSSAYSGIVYCYDMKTGDVLWTYGNGGAGNTTYSGEVVPGHYPTFVYAIGGHDLSDGVVYTVDTEHTFETPIYKGATTRAINASDGTEIYQLTAATGGFSGGAFALADGYTNFFNSYDSLIYTLGRGPSQTTITVGPKSSTLGGDVVIEGTVNDVSVGLQTTEIQGRFPSGVPVCADSSMKDWMGYVYQMLPQPADFTGVDVTISVLDSNNNYRTIGTATTDATGAYGLIWTPDISGNFTVFATFAGTNGYWPSNAKTIFNMVEAPATPTPQPTAPPTMAEQYFLPMSIIIIIAIVVVGALLALLLLRKKP
jgi:hypothetical protein